MATCMKVSLQDGQPSGQGKIMKCTSNDDRTIVSGSADKTIKIWGIDNATLIRSLSGHTGSVRSVCISNDGMAIISGSDDKTVKVRKPF